MKKPLILDFSVVRGKRTRKEFYYDDEQDVNVVLENGRKIAFIESRSTNPELVTKTFIVREQDD